MKTEERIQESVNGNLSNIVRTLAPRHSHDWGCGVVNSHVEIVTAPTLGNVFQLVCADGSKYSMECTDEEHRDFPSRHAIEACRNYIARFAEKGYPLPLSSDKAAEREERVNYPFGKFVPGLYLSN